MTGSPYVFFRSRHSASMLFPLEGQGDIEHPNKLTFSVYAAAVLVELLHRQRDAFGLTLLSDGIDRQTPCRSNAAHRQHLIAEQLHRRSLVVLFTDAFVDDRQRDDLFDALQHLRHNKHEVIIFHTFDRARELQLDYGSRPLRFVDLESGKVLRLQPSEVAQQYGDLMLRQQADLQQRAMQYRIDYVPVDVAQGFHQVILPFLLKRSKQ